MNTLTTHHNPHLDDIAGIWLLRRFHPDYRDALIEFRPQGQPIPEGEIGIGIGGGQYDEHKGGDLTQSAASLVLADVLEHRASDLEKRTLQRLITWVCDEDHAKFVGQPNHLYAFPAMMLGLMIAGHDSVQTYGIGAALLDGLFETTKEYEQIVGAASGAISFMTPWGKGIALETESHASIMGEWAYAQGYSVLIVENPRNQYRSIRAVPSATSVDLSQTFTQIKQREPEASWYLHQSKRMLLCGSDVSRGTVFSKLSLQELISLITV